MSPVALLIRTHTRVASELVARLVHTVQIIVNTALETGVTAASALVGIRQKYGLIFIRTGVRAVGSGREYTTAAARGVGALCARADTRKNDCHVGKVDQIGRLTNVRAGIRSTEADTRQCV